MKTLTDPDRLKIQPTIVATTVDSLSALPRPLRRPQAGRVLPSEATLFCVEAWLTASDPQGDADIHLVLASLKTPGTRIIGEIPDPRCSGACRSGLAATFRALRKRLTERLAVDSLGIIRVRVIGVGFFDRNHRQYGAAKNFFELHPVLALEFP